MERKSCSRCPRPADYALAFLVSTIGVQPRGQKCTQTVPLCKSCLHDATPFLVSTPLEDLQEPLRDAYTALEGGPPGSSSGVGPSPAAEEAHEGGGAALSCRPCLIACNSRHGDEVEGWLFRVKAETRICVARLVPGVFGAERARAGTRLTL
jgi:hypothetical protein